MSATHGLSREEVAWSVAQSLDAALRNDADGVDLAMAPLFREDACGWDWFNWTIGMIALATRGAPSGNGLEAVPVIVAQDVATGETTTIPIEEAPPEFPKAALIVLRLSAHFLNNQKDEARAIWTEVLRDDLARAEAHEALGGIEGDDEPSLIADVLRNALETATVVAKARKGRLQ